MYSERQGTVLLDFGPVNKVYFRNMFNFRRFEIRSILKILTLFVWLLFSYYTKLTKILNEMSDW